MANEDKATRYHRLHRRAAIGSTAIGAAALVILLITGTSAAIRDAIAAIAGTGFIATTTLQVVAVALLLAVLQFPFAFYEGVVLERRYGLSVQPPGRWLRDRLKAEAIGLLFAIGGALVVWSLLRGYPRQWWIIAALLFTGVVIVLAQLAPVLLLPIFYEFKPLERRVLVERLMTLADRAGTRVFGVFEWRVSDRTRKANAALTGMGRTRRILLSDTLLAEHSDDEIEVILAHELAHHVHHDLWSGIVLEAVLITIGFYLADRALVFFDGSFGLRGKADVAALPLLVLSAGAVAFILAPFAKWLSRSHERRADRYALAMTENVEAFTTAMRRLAAQNLAEEEPSRLVEVLFHTHPPIRARIAAAREWAKQRRGLTN